MQPTTTNISKPSHAASGQMQLELGDEESPDGADKPASNPLTSQQPSSSPQRPSWHRKASSQSVKDATALMNGTASPPGSTTSSGLTTPKASNGLKRMFRSSGSENTVTAATATTARSGSATPLATGGNGPSAPQAADARGALDMDKTHASHSQSQTHIKDSPPPGLMMNGSSGNSISPTSTLPTPPSEPSSPPASRPGSRPGSRKSSFSSNTAARPSVSEHHAHANGSSTAGTGGGQRFTLKDLLANGPKLNRRPSNSSRKSDASSEKGYGGGGGHQNGGGGGYARSDRDGAESTTSTSLLKKYGVCEKIAIGKGATSVVRLAHKWDRSEEKLYAVKEFRKRRKNETEKEYVKKLTAEFCISSTLHHVNIVETVDLVQDEAHHWCEVMEYCPGGDLYGAIKKGQMSASEIECCFKQLLTGVAYLHAQGVAHRDIKPENLFFDTHGHLKIGDYGASTVYRLPWEATVHMSTGLCGSEPYIAPEQFLRKPYDARLVDIWAVGIVYYCLLFQELPWRVAQPSDPLFAAYQTACAAKPYKASIASSTATSLTKTEDSGVSRSTTSSTSSLQSHPTQKSIPTTFPATINNIEPREARPLLRRILEPDPKLRANVNEILDNSWIREIEVCTEVNKPSHMHVNIRAALHQTVHAAE